MSLIQSPNFRIFPRMFFFIFCIFFFLPHSALAEDGAGFKLTAVKLAEGAPVQISSDSAVYDENEGFVVFTGDVRVGHGPYKIRGEKLKVIFDITQEGKKEPIELVFTKGVVFSNGFEIGKSNIANYDILSGFIILTEDVMFKQKESVFFGQSAKFDLNNNYMSFKGRINASIDTSN